MSGFDPGSSSRFISYSYTYLHLFPSFNLFSFPLSSCSNTLPGEARSGDEEEEEERGGGGGGRGQEIKFGSSLSRPRSYTWSTGFNEFRKSSMRGRQKRRFSNLHLANYRVSRRRRPAAYSLAPAAAAAAERVNENWGMEEEEESF